MSTSTGATTFADFKSASTARARRGQSGSSRQLVTVGRRVDARAEYREGGLGTSHKALEVSPAERGQLATPGARLVASSPARQEGVRHVRGGHPAPRGARGRIAGGHWLITCVIRPTVVTAAGALARQPIAAATSVCVLRFQRAGAVCWGNAARRGVRRPAMSTRRRSSRKTDPRARIRTGPSSPNSGPTS
jgi:hypothetical protein